MFLSIIKSNKYYLVFFIIAFVFTNIKAQENQAKRLDVLMNDAHKNGVFNGNVLIIRNGKLIYQSSFGYTDASRKNKLSSEYRFNIGSIAKEFNAVGIMMLEEEGKLKLDDRVSKYLTDLPAWADKISIKNLLQYASGLPDINWKNIKSDADIWKDLKRVEQLKSEPGTVYSYNNANVFLQRRIIEKIANVSFAKFVEMKMLKPCKMKDSVVDPDLKSGENVAVSFNNDFIEDARQFSYAMTGWTSVTAADLYKWTRCVDDFRLVKPNSYKQILIPFLPGKQSGLGGGIFENGAIREHTHHGSSFDFEALMTSEPRKNSAIILLTNNRNSRIFQVRDAIKAILNGESAKAPKRSFVPTLTKQIDNLTGEEIVALYNDLKTKTPDKFDFENEADLNQIGYSLFNKKRLDDAIKIFEINVRLFPASANAYDSLGEAFLAKGDKKNAAANYKKSFELNPQNLAAKEIIEKLEKENE